MASSDRKDEVSQKTDQAILARIAAALNLDSLPKGIQKIIIDYLNSQEHELLLAFPEEYIQQMAKERLDVECRKRLMLLKAVAEDKEPLKPDDGWEAYKSYFEQEAVGKKLREFIQINIFLVTKKRITNFLTLQI